MARGWITTILVIAFANATIAQSEAQMSRTRKPGGSTLASRLSQLKSAFVGEDNVDNGEVDFSEPSPSPKRTSNGNRTNSSQPPRERTANLPSRNNGRQRVQAGDLLPKGIFFDRNSSSESAMENFELGDEVFDTAPRRGSNPNNVTASKSPRKSPSTTRENELQDALDDLLAVEQEHLRSETIEPLPGSESDRATVDADTQNFDLRQALINKATSGTSPTRSQAVNDLRKQFEDVNPSMPTTNKSAAVISESTSREAENIFSGPAQSVAPVRKQPTLREARSGMLTAGGETLLNTKQPVIASRIEGPRQILVGREATYRVILENTSETSARSVSAEVRIPEWAEVVDVISTSGIVERNSSESTGVLHWQLDELTGRSAQSLSLRLVPRSGKPLNLSVEWTQAPVTSQALVEVQEPKLEMKISGPQEVLFNKAQRFQLSLRNPGTGVAENVVIKLIPPGGDESTASSHTVGQLEAGASKEIELELTAREAGELIMKASASAAGGLQTETVRQVLCRKPELELDWRGPSEKYAGTEASYYFRVRNTGTADTDPVSMRIKMPQGMKLLSASEGYQLDSKSGEISWQLERIPAGEAEFIQICCQVERAGANRFEASAQTSGGDLRSAKEIEMNVIAVADLKLQVTDPQGPVPVGETAVYEIRIRNRGTTDAQNVGVVGLFSAGIDPTSVEGAQFSVRDGRVSIHPINTLPAGDELTLRIRAVASQAGNHVFRAEVSCQDLDIKLAAEETTKFYEDQYRWEDGETAYSNDPSTVRNR